MIESVINHVVTHPPKPGSRISFIRPGASESLDLADLYEQSGRLALALARQGIGPGDRIGVLAANGLEWVLLDLAALRLKAVTAGFEPGKFAPDAALLARYDLKVLFTDQQFTDQPAAESGVRQLDEVRDLVDGQRADPVPPVVYGPADPTTVKFTSGSTGVPKGLAATAGSIDGSLRAVQEMFAHGPGDELFVFLPLSLLQQRYWIYSALCFGHDITVSTYSTAFAALRKVKPTVVMGVPAFFEIARQHVLARADRAGVSPREAADRLFGGRIRYLWTGSAPASASMLRFYGEIGLPIYEGYGLNETCIVTKNHPGAHREGSVGRIVAGKEVLIDDDGLVSVRSVHPVAVEYAYCAPGESERMFGPDGVVRTGDIGHLDSDGYLYIRGRADDVIVLEDARKIIVRPIEEHMKTSPAIDECVVFCPNRTQLVAVVSPTSFPSDTGEIAEQLARTNAALTKDERIHRVVVARERFTIENGMLTSQYKPKRLTISESYRTEINDSLGGIHAR